MENIQTPRRARWSRVPISKRASHESNPSRRSFVKHLAIATSALTLPALSYSRVLGANERLNLAAIGTGGKGASDLGGVAASPAVQVTALCDIDSSPKHLGWAAEKYSGALTFADWRELLDKSKLFEAVTVSTPDFMHAPIALAAMQLGKHVFCQKPLTHTVFEARQMRLAAARHKVVTQMGNQIQSHSDYRTAVAWVHQGVIGKVREVHSWQGSKPTWPRAIERPAGSDPVPPMSVGIFGKVSPPSDPIKRACTTLSTGAVGKPTARVSW